MQQIAALIAEKESRTPAQQKIDSQLIYAMKMSRGESIAAGVKTLNVNVATNDAGEVTVIVTALIDDELLLALKEMGVAVSGVFPEYHSLTAVTTLDQLEAIAGLSQVRFIQPPQEALLSQARPTALSPDLPSASGLQEERRNNLKEQIQQVLNEPPIRTDTAVQIGIAASQGDRTHRSFSARGTFNTDGTGIKIGVLSDGVTNLAVAQGTGDLGTVTVVPGQAGAGDEGTAMLEIIHDLAPGAQLFFATGVSNDINVFANNIRTLRNTHGCDIIVDDIGYFVETPFQDGQAVGVLSTRNAGVVTQAVNDVVASGALYFSSSANSGNKNDGTSGTWEGDFVNGGTLAPAPGGFPVGSVHDFDPTAAIAQFDTITLGSNSRVNLHWADPLGGSANDYDLFVLNSTGTAVLGSSMNPQTGTQDPYEEINVGGANATNNRVVILQKAGAANRFLHLSVNRGQLSFSTNGETHGHNAASGAYGVAASPAVGPFPNSFNSSNSVETFSSDGPRRVFFNPNSTPVTPGDFSATGGTVLQQPLITAADGVSISGAGGFPNPFFGTSAAAPHAAAIAALIKAANPALTPAQIKTALTSTAIDIETPGTDRDAGFGIIMPYLAMQSLGAPVVGRAFLEIDTVTPTETCCNSDGFILPGESGTLNISLNNTGILNATGITATLTSSTAGVTISSGNSAYPNITSPVGSGVNTTPFAFSLGGALPQDSKVNFTLTINYTGGNAPTQVWDFSVQFGLQPNSFNASASATVYALAMQPDGKIVVAGNFTGLAGGGRSGIGRLNADGSLDPTFNPGANGQIFSALVQPDGKIVVGGFFTMLGGGGSGNTPRNFIGRLNADGTLDASFNPGADSFVDELALQPDGKILVGGFFANLGGQARNFLGRLNADGSLDMLFNPGANAVVRGLAVQPDGKILVGGDFTKLGGGGVGVTSRKSIGRLNSDGTVDLPFDPGTTGTGAGVNTITIQPDGKILVGGNFTGLGGGTGATARSNIGRLNSDGTVDMPFDPGANSTVQAFALQTDLSILVGGSFTSLGGGGIGTTTRNRIGRLNSDGSLDTSFDPGASSTVQSLALQADGLILAGGDFIRLGGGGTGTISRTRIGRLSNASMAVQSLTVNGPATAITWLRSGTSPEVDRVTFESSADATTYTSLGNGTRISGGWELTGLTPLTSQNRFIRARGFYCTGLHQGTASIAETVKDRFPPTLRIDAVAAKAGRASGGQTVNLTGVFAGLSTVQMGGVGASWIYTNGAGDTSAITVTTPAHAAGAVPIVLTPTSGSVYSKANAFAYLPTVFTDDTITVGQTKSKAQHIIELRQVVDAMRAVAGLGSVPWTDPTLSSGSTIRASQILDLRNYFNDAAFRLGYSTSPYTDPALNKGFTIMRVHIEELRQRIRTIAG